MLRRFAAVIAALLAFSALAPARSTLAGGLPMAQLLNGDGTIKTGAVYGSVDVSGYRMTTAADGAPRFVAESAPFASSTLVDPDAGWDSRFWRGGVEYTVNAIAIVGSDIYVGGDIPSINNIITNGIAKWNGSTWSALGSGLNDDNAGFGIPTVYAMTVIGTDLYVAGEFVKAGGVPAFNVAKWNGSSWSALGGGVDGTAFGLAVLGADLYITGRFSVAGSVSTGPIAKWDGSSWSGLGSGLTDTLHSSVLARTMAVIGSDLYVGGSFNTAGGNSANHIAKWDGTTWSALGGGLADGPNALAVIGTDLYAAGRFHYIARWDGSDWSTFGSFDADANVLAVNGTDLYVGGAFSTVDSLSVNHIAKWDGSAWSALGSGVTPGDYSTVNALLMSGADIYAGGYGNFTTSGAPAHNLARWNNSDWSAVGQQTGGLGMLIESVPRGARVDALAVAGSNVYVAGYFTSGGDTAANYVVKWDGTSWSPLGTGMNREVNALAVVGTDLYAAGGFTTAGGVAANSIAKWDGSTWSDVGGGLDGGALALASNGSDLYVGGGFSLAGSVSVSNIAKWDGSAWSALGAGISGDDVESLAVSGTNLYAGGHFTMAGIVAANSIAKWDGANWSALGTGVKAGTDTAHVEAIAVLGTDLYAGGDFDSAGGSSAKHIARWDGSMWAAVSGGTTGYDVKALAVSGSDLFVGGSFDKVGTTNANKIAKWNGTAWAALGTGVNERDVTTLAVSGTDLYVGGNFATVGGRPSYYIAVLHPVCGNGLADLGEACDDGNLINGDGCDSNCTLSACGNGIIGGDETCDDNNAAGGDGCSATCNTEPCWACSGEPSSCSTLMDGSACDDGVFCNGSDTCTAVVCVHSGNPCSGGVECDNLCDEAHATCNLPFGTSCSADADICTDDICDAGSCTHPGNTASCDDGDACSIGDQCSGDICVPGSGTLNCDDNDPCTDDTCAPGTGCVHTNNTAPCDDGLFCTVDDMCNNNDVCLGVSRDCSDSDPCTTDMCTEVTASCDHGPQLTCGDSVKCSNEQCDDGNAVDGDGCQSDCTFTPVSVMQSVAANGTLSTDMGSGATPGFPTTTAVTVPSGGTVAITQTTAASPPASGFGVLGQQIFINAPAQSATSPLRLTFTTDISLLPAGVAVADLQISKDGVLLPDCSGPAGEASPDPCITSRALDMNGDIQIVALTSSASTWATLAPAHDSVVLPLAPLTITIPPGATTYSKKLKVGVLNADILPLPEVNGHTIQLSASSDCPAGVTLSTPDFDTSTPAADPAVTLAGGKSKKATVILVVDATGIANLTTVNKKAPTRCHLTFTATTTLPGGNVDPVGSNDVATVDVNFIDKHDAQQSTMHESVVGTVKAVKINVAATLASKPGSASVKVVNADYLPLGELPGHTITVTATDGTCPPGTVGVVDYDKATTGSQSSVVLKGGAAKSKPLPLTINPGAFHSGNAKSPARCTASVSVDRPAGDVDATNNTAHIVIDVVDHHDF